MTATGRRCGDGYVNRRSEDCDLGAERNSDAPNGARRTDCARSVVVTGSSTMASAATMGTRRTMMTARTTATSTRDAFFV